MPPVEAYVPAGQSRVVSISQPAGATNLVRLQLAGDDEPFDNAVYVAPKERRNLRVGFIGADTGSDARQPLYFLARAFQNTAASTVQLAILPPEKPISQDDLRGISAVIATSPLSPAGSKELHQWLKEGNSMLCCLGGETDAQPLGELLGRELTPLSSVVHPDSGAILAAIDFQHPLFAPFADPRYSDFSKIRFWKHCVLDAAQIPDARALASFDSGAPALLECNVGKGKLFVLTSGWTPAESQLALSTKFVPLLYSFLELTSSTEPPPTQFFAGDNIPVETNTVITFQDASPVEVLPGGLGFQGSNVGLYGLKTGDRTRLIAVNTDPLEGRLQPLTADSLETLGVPLSAPPSVAAQDRKRQVELKNSELEGRQKLWLWVMLGTMLLLLVESLVAWGAARKAQPVQQVKAAYGT
jgi:hypothetical protein